MNILRALTRVRNGLRQFSTTPTAPALTAVEDVGTVRTITLNNPKKRNALSYAMLSELREHLLAAASSPAIKSVVIAHEGPVFSSGHDLKELTEETGMEYHKKVFDLCSTVMMLVQDIPVPVIACVNGLATAAGCQLVASCDIAIATTNSRFATPGVNVGLFCSTPAVAVARAVPRKVAAEMLFTGEPIDAETALQHGLLSRVVENDQLDTEVAKVTEKIGSVSKDVTAVGKACLYKQIAMNRNDAYHLAGQTMVDNLKMDDGREGINAFIQKRKPVWK